MKVNLSPIHTGQSYYADLFIQKENQRSILTYLYYSIDECIIIIHTKAGYPDKDKKFMLYKG